MRGKIFRTFLLAVTAIGMIVCSIAMVPLLIVFSFYWCFVYCVSKVLRKDFHKFVKGYSNALTIDHLEDPQNYPKFNLCLIWVSDRHVPLEEVRQLVNNNMVNKKRKNSDELLYPELQQYLTRFMGYNFWQWNRQFRLEDHVREYDYGGDMALPEVTTDDDLRRIFKLLLKQTWIPKRGYWELLQIKNYCGTRFGALEKPETKGIYIMRMHHMLGDGRSIMRLIWRDVLEVPEYKLSPIKFERKTTIKKVLKALPTPFFVPWQMAKMIVMGLNIPSTWKLKRSEFDTKDFHVDFSAPIPTSVIKKIKNQNEVSYNVAIMATVARGYQRMVEATCADRKAPKRMSCLIPVPMPNHPEGLVNHALFVPLELPIQTKSFEDCIQKIVKEAKRSNISGIGVALYFTSFYYHFIPNFGLRLGLWSILYPPAVVSIVPGPTETIHCLGSKLEDLLCGMSLVVGEIASTITGISYNGEQRVGLTICTKICPTPEDAKRFCGFLNEEVQDYMNRHRDGLQEAVLEIEDEALAIKKR